MIPEQYLGMVIVGVFTISSSVITILVNHILTKRRETRRQKASEIRNELEKAYGTLYSIVSKAEEIVKVEKGSELRVVVSREEMEELDRILMSYPHMFPQKIVVLWRTEMRNLAPCRSVKRYNEVKDYFGIPVEFKEEITKEYEQRLEEYYKTTKRWKILKGLPKWLRA